MLCNRKPHKRQIICLWVTEFKDLKISQESRDVYVGNQTGFHNEEQLFHAVGSEAPPFLEAAARSAKFFPETHKSPVTCPWL